MMIDWFTVVAQAFNFLILVWLLKHFLYQPILDAIDAREQRISNELADADAKRSEARQERDEFERKNQELAEQRESLVSQMHDEVNTTRQKLLEEAHHAADSLSTKRKLAFQREQQNLTDEISHRTQDQVFSIARKALVDLADTQLEASITSVFTRRLRELPDDARKEFSKSLTALSDPARVRSAFELPSEQQQAIRQALNETFTADIPVRFETAPEIISGIELISNGRLVAWSLDGYLGSLKKSLSEPANGQVQHNQEPEFESEPV